MPDPTHGSPQPLDLIETHNQHADLFAEKCPSRQVLKHVTSQWGVLVLVALLDGTHRFAELRRRLGGVSEKMLAQTLRQLEGDGFVLRRSLPVIPPHVEYSLTGLGRTVAGHVRTLAAWIEDNFPDIRRAQAAQHAGCGPDSAR